MLRSSILALAVAAVGVVSAGCASAPAAFSVDAVDSPIRADQGAHGSDSALALRFQLVNRTDQLQTLAIWPEAIHIESVKRNGRAVQPEDYEPRLYDDPRTLRSAALPVIAGDGLVAFFAEHGLYDQYLVGDTWHRRVFPLVPGKYRVVFSYHYDGPDDGKPNVFHGRLVASPIRFTVE